MNNKSMLLFWALVLFGVCSLYGQYSILPICEETFTGKPDATFSDVVQIQGKKFIGGYTEIAPHQYHLNLYRQGDCSLVEYPSTALLFPPLFLLPMPSTPNEFVMFSSGFDTAPTLGTGPTGMVQIVIDPITGMPVSGVEAAVTWLADGYLEKAVASGNSFCLVGGWDMDEDLQIGVLSLVNSDLEITRTIRTPLSGQNVDGTFFDGFSFYDVCSAGSDYVVLAYAYHSPEEGRYDFADYAMLKYGADGTLIWSTIPQVAGTKIRPLVILANLSTGYVLLSREIGGARRLMLQGFDNSDNELWLRYYPEIGSGVWNMRLDQDGATQLGYIIYGSQSSRGWLARVDNAGYLYCSGWVESSSADQFASVATLQRDNYIAVGNNSGLPWYGIFDLPCSFIVKADFYADLTAGPSPFRVSFKNQSTGNIQSQLWDFGDGETSQDANPTHIYRTPGLYSVTLTVSDGIDQDVMSKTDYIQVYEAEQKNYTVRQANNIVIDGDLSDWPEVEEISSTDNPDNPFSSDDLTASYRMAWNGLDLWYIGFTIEDNIIGHTTPLSSFADDPQGSQGISKYYLNDCIEAIFARDGGGPKFDAFKLVFAPDEPVRTLYQAEDIRLHPWLEWGTVNPLIGPHADRSAKVPPVCVTQLKVGESGWQGEAALQLTALPDPGTPYRFIFSFNDIDDQVDAATRHHVNTIGGNLDVWVALDQLFGAMPIIQFDQSTDLAIANDAVPHQMALACAPNPFNQSTRIHLTVVQSGWVDLVVYDVSGRRVADLLHKRLEAGAYDLTWEGLIANRMPAPSGVYFIRMRCADQLIQAKVTLVR
ncbi:PKD domain-containing protein [candidate division KSB1 bacterium]|nr:PKD domain-containing protein [candidate division KSB1 bacterium]